MSYRWLTDPEIARLTMAPELDRTSQARWFEGLSGRADYRIWGVVYAGKPIGAAGLKDIRANEGEVFLYIGEREFWGRGFGNEILDLIEVQARLLGLETVSAKVARDNRRSLRAFKKAGYEPDGGTASLEILRKALRGVSVD